MLKKVLFFLVCFVSLHAMEPEVQNALPTLATLCCKPAAEFLVKNRSNFDDQDWKNVQCLENLLPINTVKLKDELVSMLPSRLLTIFRQEGIFSSEGNILLLFSPSNDENNVIGAANLAVLNPLTQESLHLQEPINDKIVCSYREGLNQLKIFDWFKKGKYIFVESAPRDLNFSKEAIMNIWHVNNGKYAGGISCQYIANQFVIMEEGELIAVQTAYLSTFETKYYQTSNLAKPKEVFAVPTHFPGWSTLRTKKIKDPQKKCLVSFTDEHKDYQIFLYDPADRTFSPPLLKNRGRIVSFSNDGSHYLTIHQDSGRNAFSIQDRQATTIVNSLWMDEDLWKYGGGIDKLRFIWNKDNSKIALCSSNADVMYGWHGMSKFSHNYSVPYDTYQFVLHDLQLIGCLRLMANEKGEYTQFIIKSMASRKEIYKRIFEGEVSYITLLHQGIIALKTNGPRVILFDTKSKQFENLDTTQEVFQLSQSCLASDEMVIEPKVSTDGTFLKRNASNETEVRQFINPADTFENMLR